MFPIIPAKQGFICINSESLFLDELIWGLILWLIARPYHILGKVEKGHEYFCAWPQTAFHPHSVCTIH